MSERLNADSCKILGLYFFNGSLADALKLSRKGGLVVAPSGPGLASDLTNCGVYARALLEADLVIAGQWVDVPLATMVRHGNN